jgi:O-antigen/teichoic acid export membrane protein
MVEKQNDSNLATGARGGAIAFILKIASAFFAILNQIVLARILGAGGMGEVLLALSVIFIASQIAKFGMEDAMMRFIPMYIEKKDSKKLKGTIYFTLRFCFFASVSFIFIVLAFSEFISINIFNSDRLIQLLPIAVIALPLSAVRGVTGGILKGYRDTLKALLPEFVVSPFFRILIFLLLSIRGNNPEFAIYAFVAGEALAVLLSAIFLLKKIQTIKTNTHSCEYKEVMSVAFTMIFTSLSIILFTQTDLWIIGMYSSTESVGIYGAATKLVNLIILPLGIFSAIIPPLIASLHTSGDLIELTKVVRASSRWILSASMPVILMLIFEGNLILKYVFGTGFTAGYTALLILSAGQIINASTGLVGYLLQMTGGHRVLMKINIFWGILNVLLNIVLVPRLGIFGAALSTAFSLAMANITAVIAVRRRLSVLTLANGLHFDIIYISAVGSLYIVFKYMDFFLANHIVLFVALAVYIWKSIVKHDLPWRLIIDKFKET